jgi:hypothetical protein
MLGVRAPPAPAPHLAPHHGTANAGRDHSPPARMHVRSGLKVRGTWPKTQSTPRRRCVCSSSAAPRQHSGWAGGRSAAVASTCGTSATRTCMVQGGGFAGCVRAARMHARRPRIRAHGAHACIVNGERGAAACRRQSLILAHGAHACLVNGKRGAAASGRARQAGQHSCIQQCSAARQAVLMARRMLPGEVGAATELLADDLHA